MKRLEHESDVPAANCGAAIFIEFSEIDTGDHHASGAGRIKAGQQRQQRGLTRAGSADDGQLSPALTVKLTSARMVRAPAGLATVFDTFLASRTICSCIRSARETVCSLLVLMLPIPPPWPEPR